VCCAAVLIAATGVAFSSLVLAVIGPAKALALARAASSQLRHTVAAHRSSSPPKTMVDERSWPCMAKFRAHQQWHANAQASWANIPPGGWNWLWPAPDKRPLVTPAAATARTGRTVIIAGVVRSPSPDHIAAHIPVRVLAA
jgi:hypothetical protein